VSTFFTPFEVKPRPKGLKDFQKWMKKGDFEQTTASRRRARSSSRQKIVGAINKMTDYTAGGLLAGIDWTTAHRQNPPQGFGALSEARLVDRSRRRLRVENGKFVPFGVLGSDRRASGVARDRLTNLAPARANALEVAVRQRWRMRFGFRAAIVRRGYSAVGRRLRWGIGGSRLAR
jgi:hypothetical protein